MSPEEWHKKQVIEEESDVLESNLEKWTKYDLYHAVKELEHFFDEIQQTFHMTLKQSNYAARARLTFDKIFKYKQ